MLKENKQTMTDVGKYNYSEDPTSGASTLKEFSLRKQLEDSELAQQELRVALQESKDHSNSLELKLRTKETEF